MITQDNYLDLANLLINELFGDVVLFIIVGIVLIAYWSVKNNLPFQVTIVSVFLFSGLVVAYLFNSVLWIIILLVVALSAYGLYAKIIKSNL